MEILLLKEKSKLQKNKGLSKWWVAHKEEIKNLSNF